MQHQTPADELLQKGGHDHMPSAPSQKSRKQPEPFLKRQGSRRPCARSPGDGARLCGASRLHCLARSHRPPRLAVLGICSSPLSLASSPPKKRPVPGAAAWILMPDARGLADRPEELSWNYHRRRRRRRRKGGKGKGIVEEREEREGGAQGKDDRLETAATDQEIAGQRPGDWWHSMTFFLSPELSTQ
ncbi:Hypothetical predicted protein [Podarcis lilfordi]|uniref:Uncharacterized protein n=1 Tax=Podarcis lilfordi TaxID=74358 RepID=A0AA35KGG2_9SAUR|nr:Hypothetical predicted protein [Podarcis lilfordi]